jgi:hypothetical protein
MAPLPPGYGPGFLVLHILKVSTKQYNYINLQLALHRPAHQEQRIDENAHAWMKVNKLHNNN